MNNKIAKWRSLLPGLVVLAIFLIWTTLVASPMMWHFSGLDWLDTSGRQFLIVGRTEFATKILQFITALMGAPWVILFFLLFVLILWKQQVRLTKYVASVAGVFVIMTLLKRLLGRIRPVGEALVFETDPSYPSGHASAAVAVVGVVVWLLTASMPRLMKWLWRSATVLFVFTIGLSRVYLGVHWPSDIIGAYLLAISVAALTSAIVDFWLEKYRQSR